MKKCLVVFLFFVVSFLLFPHCVSAQKTPTQTFVKAEVTKILKEDTKTIGGKENAHQIVEVKVLEGNDKDKTLKIDYGGTSILPEEKKVHTGDTVIISSMKNQSGKTEYIIVDTYRLNPILSILLAFFALVIITAGKKGIGAILGLLISLGVIVGFIIPQILAGNDPLLISIIGSLFIMVTTIYLAHGFSQQTTIAIISTFLCLGLTGFLAVYFVQFAHLSGLGSEDAYSLQLGFGGKINFQGLLLGGIIIGALGVLDDTTTTQVTTVAELARTNPSLTIEALIKKGMIVGREHITSLVNTLVLAYAGASIGIFIFLVLTLRNNTQPLWVILNSEVITEEVIRTLAGSMGLILAVPITTVLAAFFSKFSVKVQ